MLPSVKAAMEITPRRQRKRRHSFTLVEMLTVIMIIGILASLILFAGAGIINKMQRSRALTEIKGMGQALDNYKVDNGYYPAAGNISAPPYSGSSALNPTSAGYLANSEALFSALAGSSSFTNTPTSKVYYSFRANQVGSPTNTSYVIDPFGYSYGYSTNSPLNGSGMYDLWSTAGSTGSNTSNGSSPTNVWINNWNM